MIPKVKLTSTYRPPISHMHVKRYVKFTQTSFRMVTIFLNSTFEIIMLTCEMFQFHIKFTLRQKIPDASLIRDVCYLIRFTVYAMEHESDTKLSQIDYEL